MRCWQINGNYDRNEPSYTNDETAMFEGIYSIDQTDEYNYEGTTHERNKEGTSLQLGGVYHKEQQNQ